MSTRLEEMTDVERQAAFDKWFSGKVARKAKSKGRREATKALIKAHKAEYDSLVAKAGGAEKAKGK